MGKSNGKDGNSLTKRIFIGMLLGLAVGLTLNNTVGSAEPVKSILVEGVFYCIGQGFIRLVQMIVVPLVFFSLICGISTISDTRTLGRVGGRVVLYYLATTVMAVMIALGVAFIINPGVGLNIGELEMAETQIGSDTGIVDMILNIIPKNPFQALANGDMLAVIFFALMVGFILSRMKERASVIIEFVHQANDLMLDMTLMVMKAAPVGVFCLIARTFTNLGFSAMVPLIKYILAVLIALAIHLVVVYSSLLKVMTGLSPLRFFQKLMPVIEIAFSTAASNATIPLDIETLETKVGVPRKLSSFSIPLGATINMDGCSIMQGVAVVFVAQAYGIPLTPGDYLVIIVTATLASISSAGVPGAALVVLAMVLKSVGLPVEAIGIIMGVDRILDMSRTAVNVVGDAVCTTIVADKEGMLDRKVFESDAPVRGETGEDSL